MKFMDFTKWIKDAKGVATSLIEATATVAVGAVLAGVAVGGAIDAINDSKIQAAIADVSSIGQGVINFYKDNAFFPLFTEGDHTGSGDPIFHFLVSENGTYPTDATTGDFKWDVPDSSGGTAIPDWNGEPGYFGHMPDYQPDGHDSIEGHLIKNQLGGIASSASYPRRGAYVGDPERGWANPYVSSLPKTDPWGNKYMINVRNLHSKWLLDNQSSLPNTVTGTLPQIAVIVLSAGPNRQIDTQVAQGYNDFTAQGDDIVFRLK